MTAFKRIIFLLMVGGAVLFASFPPTPPASPGSGLVLGALLLLLSSLAVPGPHVEWVARLVSLPFVAVLGANVAELGKIVLQGEFEIQTWKEAKGLAFLVLYLYIFGSVLVKGRLPSEVANMFTRHPKAD